MRFSAKFSLIGSRIFKLSIYLYEIRRWLAKILSRFLVITIIEVQGVLKMEDLKKRIEELAVELTRVRSVVETKGEVAVATKIYDILGQFPYFKTHPAYLFKVPVADDPLGRFSVIALLKGEKTPQADTVITLGHFDTVGTSDYGNLEHLATEPYELTEALKDLPVSVEVKADLESDKYLCGRGLFDMKTGDAILIAIMEKLAKDPKSFQGNLIYVAVCDEEANSKGMLAAVPELVALGKREQLNYLALLDTDYMTSEYQGDDNKYVYVGTVGKLMPSFYVVGKETHVGEAFKGLDANGLAAEIVGLVNLNPAYCDVVEGEVTLPPVTLKMRDLKTEYSVQTTRTANVYFNYATHSSTPSDVLLKMKAAGLTAFESVLTRLNEHYKTYCDLAQRPFQTLPFTPRVMTFRELFAAVQAEQTGPDVSAGYQALVQELKQRRDLDDRDKALKLVEYVHDLWSDRDPVIIVYLTPPYYPHIYVNEATEKGKRLLSAVSGVVSETDAGYPLVFKKFFPYISDLSYGGAPKDDRVIEDLKGNMPGFGVTYDLPVSDMQALDLPVLDIGPFGKDAHKFTERIETEYSFEVAPRLTWQTIMKLLNN